ncbi:MAG: hypothetical protein HFH65_03755 [Lachnospiraceae bacterium]|nr:hypothetical protein [Lachnospiraceae bacterium]
MKEKDFFSDIKSGLQGLVGEDCVAKLVQIDKNNGVKAEGIIVKDDKNYISPVIYLDTYYEQYKKGKAENDIINEIYQIYQKYSCEINLDLDIKIQDLNNYEKIKKKVAYKLINYEKNEEILLNIPYIHFLDLAIVFFVMVSCQKDSGIKNAAFPIRKEHLKTWGVAVEDIYRDALYNTPDLFPFVISPMGNLLAELICKELKGDIFEETDGERMQNEFERLQKEYDSGVYVLTNTKNVNGASCMLYKNVIKEFAEKEHTDFYIIPSSIHEVLLFPISDKRVTAEDLKGMVIQVNRTEIDEYEILSDNIYYYNSENDSITIVF